MSGKSLNPITTEKIEDNMDLISLFSESEKIEKEIANSQNREAAYNQCLQKETRIQNNLLAMDRAIRLRIAEALRGQNRKLEDARQELEIKRRDLDRREQVLEIQKMVEETEALDEQGLKKIA